MRIFNYAVAAAFFAMAGLQFNDPDPVYWVAVYGGTGLVALGKGLRHYSEFWAAIVIGAIISGMIIAFPGVVNFFEHGEFRELYESMTSSKAYVESTREFAGLLLALIVLTSYIRR
ncbi:MAG: transmembrane 220 family protein [Woeseia sp.]